MNQLPGKIALPTSFGLQFLEHNHILLFRNRRETEFEKPCWEVLLSDLMQIKLSSTMTAEKIMKLLPHAGFFPINQSVILNLTFVDEIIFKSHQCELIAPLKHIKLTISRSQLLKLKEIYDIR